MGINRRVILLLLEGDSEPVDVCLAAQEKLPGPVGDRVSVRAGQDRWLRLLSARPFRSVFFTSGAKLDLTPWVRRGTIFAKSLEHIRQEVLVIG